MKRFLFILALISALVMLAVPVTMAQDSCEDEIGCVEIGADDPIVIATMLVRSGPNALLGEDSAGAVEIAVAQRDGMLLGRDIEVVDEDAYSISIAVAGFDENDIQIEVEKGVLTVAGKRQDDNRQRQYLHQGIAARSFERKFNLADHVEVTGANLKNGLLVVDLERRIPEAMKPRRIAIGSGEANSIIEQDAANQNAA